MNINFKTSLGDVFTLTFAPTDTFEHVLSQAMAHLNTVAPPGRAYYRANQWTLIYQGRSYYESQLQRTLEEYNAKNGDTIVLQQRFKFSPFPLSGQKRPRPNNSNARKTRRARKNRRGTRRM